MRPESRDAGSQGEAFRERVETALGEGLEEQWDAVLAQWSGAGPSDRKAVRSFVLDLRDRVLDSLQQSDAREDFNRGLALQYLAVKSRWVLLSTRLQEQAQRAQGADEALFYRTTCVGLLLQALDPHLDPDELDALADRLGEPLGTGSFVKDS